MKQIKDIANPIKFFTKLYNPRTGKYIIKYSFRFTHKIEKLEMANMEDDIEEEKKDEIKEEKKEDDIYKGLGSSFSAFISLNEEDKISPKEKEILNYKRNRGKRGKKSSAIGVARKIRKIEPSTAQKVFNILSKKDSIDDNAVIAAASDANFSNISKDNIEFFINLGKARANLRKFGIPGTICKSPFHLFKVLYPYDATKVFTNDTNVINAYYWLLFRKNIGDGGLKEYYDLCKDSILKDFSIVTDKTFVCDSVLSGYVQDNSKTVSLICPRPLSQKEMEEFATAIQSNKAGAIFTQVTSPSGETIYFLQYDVILVVSPEEINLDNVLPETANVRCVNSKNNLQAGLKDVKIDTNLGSYLNVHDVKTTDFSPSCLFINPAVKKPKMFISVELETNSVYNSIVMQLKKAKQLKDLQMPETSIFWDNIDSIVQILSFIRLIDKPGKELDEEMLYVISKYLEYRNNFSTWKRLYNSFETIVLSFYDKITTKLSIDNITALKAKIDKFISDFNNEKSNSGAYSSILKIISFLPGTKLMNNFIGTNLSIELIYAISRLIAILKTAEGNTKSPINDLFKSIGLTCTNILFDGSIPMVPKIRAKSAFLGGLMTDMTKDEYDSSIKYLVDSFKKNYADSLKKDENVNIEDINVIDDLVKTVIRNTIQQGNSDYLKNNVEIIISKIMSDENLFPRLRENILEMMKLNAPDDIKLKGDFGTDESFMTYLATIDNLGNAMNKNEGDADAEDIAGMVKAAQESKDEKSARIKKFKKILKPDMKKKIFEITKYKKKKKAVKVKRDKAKKVLKKNVNEKKQKEAEEDFEIVIKGLEGEE